MQVGLELKWRIPTLSFKKVLTQILGWKSLMPKSKKEESLRWLLLLFPKEKRIDFIPHWNNSVWTQLVFLIKISSWNSWRTKTRIRLPLKLFSRWMLSSECQSGVFQGPLKYLPKRWSSESIFTISLFLEINLVWVSLLLWTPNLPNTILECY